MKHIFLFLLLFSVIAKASPLDCLKAQLSSETHFARAAFSEINSSTPLESLSGIYTYLREVTDNKLIKNLEAKRLINPEDWKKASDQLKENAWRTYGNQTINDWFKGREFVLSLPKDRPIDNGLLKEIHKIVSENHKFHGFEGRRLLERFRRGEISKQELDALVKRAFEKNEELAGTPHSSLRGIFRHEPIDQITHRGSSFKEERLKVFY